ncbi:MAG TPA: DsbC family protein [Gammaproteobacteria bacterium]|nr:DsbC family protein [Gammaproteobacteria bacterium]
MQKMRFAICLFALLVAGAAYGGDDVTARLAKQFGISPADVTPAPIPGLYRLVLGPQVGYVTADGRYLVRGDIVDIKDGDNLTAEDRAAARLAYIKSLGEQNMIVFAAPHPRHTLTVLTDIDCGFCRQLARDMPQLTAMGIELRYIPFPRAGVDSSSWDKAVSVWCAKDRQTAYRDAMLGAPVVPLKCDPAPVAAGYEFAQKLGLEGTPAIITETGRLIGGYLPAPQLAQLLDNPTPGMQDE